MLLHYLPNRHPFSGISIFEFADAVKILARAVACSWLICNGVWHCFAPSCSTIVVRVEMAIGGYKHTDILLVELRKGCGVVAGLNQSGFRGDRQQNKYAITENVENHDTTAM